MGRGRREDRWSYWRELLAKQQASDVSVSAFCRDQGVSDASFYTWRRRLEAEVRNNAKPSSAPFVAVPLTNARVDFEVRLPSGIVVTVPRGFDEAALKRLLQTMTSLERDDA